MACTAALGVWAVAAATAAPSAVRVLGVDDGLSHGAVYSIAEDGDGFLWLATQGGVDRYDGYGVAQAGRGPAGERLFPGSDADALVRDGRGRLWIGSWGGGLTVHDPADGSWRTLRRSDDPRSLPDDRVQRLLLDARGTLWVGTYRGLARVGGDGTVQRIALGSDPATAHPRVWALAAEPSGVLWIGTEAGLLRFDPASGHIERFGNVPTDPRSLVSDAVRALLVDGFGRLWVGTERGLDLRLLAAPALGFAHLRHDPADPASLADDSVNELLAAPDGRLWVGTQHAGVDLVDAQSARCDHLATTVPALAGADVRALHVDRSGLLWVGTRGGGAVAVDLAGPKFAKVPATQVQAVLVDSRRTLWLGTADRLEAIAADGSRRTWRYDPRDPASPLLDSVEALAEDAAGRVWIGTYGGLQVLAPGGDALVEQPAGDPALAAWLRSARIEALLVDDAGRLWVGTRAGILRSRPDGGWDRLRLEPGGREGLADGYVTALFEGSDGTVWVGTELGGVYRRVVEGDGGERFERLGGGPPPGALSDPRVTAVRQAADGTLWVGTAYGLDACVPATAKCRHYLEAQGLPNPQVMSLELDRRGRVWVATHAGLTRLDPATGATHTFAPSDGLQGRVFVQGASHAAGDELAVGGRDGANRFDPEAIRENPYRPPVVVTGLTVMDEPRAVGTRPSRLDLDWRDTFFAFTFAALDFRDPARNLYRYRLDGLDRGWSKPGTARVARYTAVPPGDYVFRVQASNADGVWNDAGLAVAVHVAPPFWKTRTFRVAAPLALALLLWSLHRARLRAIRRRNEELERLVAIRTREIAESREQVARQKEQLEVLDQIVRLINEEVELDPLLQAIVEAVCFLAGAELGMALLPRDGELVAVAGSGWNDGMPAVALAPAELERRFLAPLAPLGGSSRIRSGRGRDSLLAPRGGALLAIEVCAEGGTVGYLLFGSHDETSFADLGRIAALESHVASAFVKGRLLDELRRLDRVKNEFLGIAAHDLRTPLGAVIGTTDLLLRLLDEERLDPKLFRRFLGNVREMAEQMRALVGDLLDVAAIESGRVRLDLAPQPLAELVREWAAVHGRMAAEKSIALEIGEGPPVEVLADRARVVEVLDNLLSNAIKFTATGGAVRVSWERRNGSLVTHVADTGQGLEPDEVALVFSGRKLSARPTAGEVSTGLGLVIVKKLVELQGGELWVESTRGVGSTFSFSLPVARG